MTHHFNVEVAEQFGVNAAILLQNISFWVAKSAANGDNFHDGDFWTYNSNKAFQKLFPYLTSEQIRYALKKLIDGGVIKTGCFNEAGYDRTRWFALTEEGKSISGFSQMGVGMFTNGNGNIPEPIPDIKPDKNFIILGDESPKPQNKKRFVPPTLEEVRAYCQERGNSIDPQQFLDHYEANGWMRGKTKIKDWRACVRTWEKNETPSTQTGSEGYHAPVYMGQDENGRGVYL